MEQKIKCFNEDIMNLLDKQEFKDMFKDTKGKNLIYIDPPYGGQSSDYVKLYSFLEEYVELKPIDKIKRLKEANRYKNKNGYINNFLLLCFKLKDLDLFDIFLFSYNESSFLPIFNIKNILSKYFNNIIIKEKDYQYQYRKDKDYGKEYLIICEK